MSTCVIGIKPEDYQKWIQNIQDKNPDSLIVLPIINTIEVLSPTKKRKCHRFKVEFEIPAEAINTDYCLDPDFGMLPAPIRLPKNKITQKYLDDLERNNSEPK